MSGSEGIVERLLVLRQKMLWGSTDAALLREAADLIDRLTALAPSARDQVLLLAERDRLSEQVEKQGKVVKWVREYLNSSSVTATGRKGGLIAEAELFVALNGLVVVADEGLPASQGGVADVGASHLRDRNAAE
jgi:hypothetical protein